MDRLRKTTLGFLLFAAIATAADTSLIPRRPVLLRLVGPDALTAQLMVAGTKDRTVYFFRDPDGRRLRVERSGDFEHGFTRAYVFVDASSSAHVEIRDFQIFYHQGLALGPHIIDVNGVAVAGYVENDGSGTETKNFGKRVYAEIKKLPSDFQTVLYNFTIYCEGIRRVGEAPVAMIDTDAGKTGILLSDNWGTLRLPSYEVQVSHVPGEDQVASFQRLFSE